MMSMYSGEFKTKAPGIMQANDQPLTMGTVTDPSNRGRKRLRNRRHRHPCSQLIRSSMAERFPIKKVLPITRENLKRFRASRQRKAPPVPAPPQSAEVGTAQHRELPAV